MIIEACSTCFNRPKPDKDQKSVNPCKKCYFVTHTGASYWSPKCHPKKGGQNGTNEPQGADSDAGTDNDHTPDLDPSL